jgi:hypothetical protein
VTQLLVEEAAFETMLLQDALRQQQAFDAESRRSHLEQIARRQIGG